MIRLTVLGMEAGKARHTPSPECSPSPRQSLDASSCQSSFSLKIPALVRPSTLFIVGILLLHLCHFMRSLPPDSGDAWITKASGIAGWLWHGKRAHHRLELNSKKSLGRKEAGGQTALCEAVQTHLKLASSSRMIWPLLSADHVWRTRVRLQAGPFLGGTGRLLT